MQEVHSYGPKSVYFYSDGPRSVDDMASVESCRSVFQQFDWQCEVRVTLREQNFGCGLSIKSGLDDLFSQEPAAIILEDDCIPSQAFFSFVGSALQRYQFDPEIFMVSGFNELGHWPFNKNRNMNLFGLGGIWGWATWSDRWALMDYDLKLLSSPQLGRSLSFWRRAGVPKRRIEGLLKGAASVQAGQVDTWDYQWAMTRLFHLGHSVTPPLNLVENVGNGASATHTRGALGFPKSWNPQKQDWLFRSEVRLDSWYIKLVDVKRLGIALANKPLRGLRKISRITGHLIGALVLSKGARRRPRGKRRKLV